MALSKIKVASTDGTIGSETGSIVPWGGTSAPTGWLECDGSAVSRTTYSALFTAIGTTYGSGDGSTTFNVPDIRGRTVCGKDNMGGSSADRVTDANADSLGGSLGAETHTLTIAEMPLHNHYIVSKNSGTVGNLGVALCAAEASDDTITSNDRGGGGSHNNCQPSLTMAYIIKT